MRTQVIEERKQVSPVTRITISSVSTVVISNTSTRSDIRTCTCTCAWPSKLQYPSSFSTCMACCDLTSGIILVLSGFDVCAVFVHVSRHDPDYPLTSNNTCGAGGELTLALEVRVRTTSFSSDENAYATHYAYTYTCKVHVVWKHAIHFITLYDMYMYMIETDCHGNHGSVSEECRVSNAKMLSTCPCII